MRPGVPPLPEEALAAGMRRWLNVARGYFLLQEATEERDYA